MLTLKDLAQKMALHPKSVKRWWKRLKVPPTVPAHRCHRWDEADAKRLLKRWETYSKAKNLQKTRAS